MNKTRSQGRSPERKQTSRNIINISIFVRKNDEELIVIFMRKRGYRLKYVLPVLTYFGETPASQDLVCPGSVGNIQSK